MIKTIASLSRAATNPCDDTLYLMRLGMCAKCRFSKTLKVRGLGTATCCGTPVVGQTIDYRGHKVRLCGCSMNVKGKDPIAECPIGKW